jgi:uncharacterized protein
MYMGREILIVSPLFLYAGFRVGSLLRGAGKRILWAVLFFLLCLGYPMAEFLEHSAFGARVPGFVTAGYVALPFLLYLVMTVLAADILTGLARLGRLLSKETLRRPAVRRIRAGILLLLPAAVIAFGAWNFNRMQIREYTVDIPRKSSQAEGLTIVFASDFHLAKRTPRRIMERFADMVNALRPDMVLIGGDIVEGRDPSGEYLERAAAAFRRIRSTYGLFGVLGNHDAFGRNGSAFFDKAGIRILRDEFIRIDAAIYLAGRRDARPLWRGEQRKSIDELLSAVPEDLPIVLLDHRPTDLDNVSRSRADLQISGHTHNGQIFPLNLAAKHEYQIPWGYGIKGKTQVIVSSGIQGWGPPIRTASVSEIVVVRVRFRAP